jgi:hypothetical protein
MLEQKYHRGFSPERLEQGNEPRVKKDDKGFYTLTLSEKAKVYFEDYYTFLEKTYVKASGEKVRVNAELNKLVSGHTETAAYYRAKLVIIDVLMKTIRRFYTDGSNLGVVMTPWCFGTVVLEKLELHRERLGKGDVHDENISDYPFYALQYIDEIHRVTLLELFDFPENAFQMRWQYSELLKRYSRILTDITSSLQSVMQSVRNLAQ